MAQAKRREDGPLLRIHIRQIKAKAERCRSVPSLSFTAVKGATSGKHLAIIVEKTRQGAPLVFPGGVNHQVAIPNDKPVVCDPVCIADYIANGTVPVNEPRPWSKLPQGFRIHPGTQEMICLRLKLLQLLDTGCSGREVVGKGTAEPDLSVGSINSRQILPCVACLKPPWVVINQGPITLLREDICSRGSGGWEGEPTTDNTSVIPLELTDQFRGMKK